MEKKNNSLVIILMGVIIVILAVLCVLFATDTISFKSNNDSNVLDGNVSTDNSASNDIVENNNSISQEELEKIVKEELYIITNRNTGRKTIKSLSDIESYDLETLAINKFNSSSSTLTSISKNEMQDILNDTCLSNLSISFEGTYTKNEYTKRNLYYGNIGAYKTVSFNENNDKYELAMKFIFVDNGDSGDRGWNGYGDMDSLKDMITNNSVVQIYDDNGSKKVDDLQKYLNDNYDNIKEKLSTYRFTFEKQNDKLVLTGLSVN